MSSKIPEAMPPSAAFPIVGIGASAGGLAAFEAFFRALPAAPPTGMAYVLVQHLAPDHKSLLAELIRRCTSLPVAEIVDGMPVQPDCVHVIPPGFDLVLRGATLHLSASTAPRGQRLPIDRFFRSLAETLHERAIGIVLSGTGSDGSLGVRAIKGEGGMVMAQNPASCDFDGMPSSAIATGQVDYQLPPAEMPARLAIYAGRALGPGASAGAGASPAAQGALAGVLSLLRERTGHDFALYKAATVERRVARRMAVHQIDAVDDYVKYLQQTAAEVQALFHDLLIGVTSFFRDPQAFQALEGAIARMLAAKTHGAPLRVWVPGCSTGEEAYSIAILLREQMQASQHAGLVQVFATDIDGRAIANARAGVYAAAAVAELPAQRLAEFFTSECEGSVYRASRSVRELLVFSEQDLIRDPPFSRLDLISCRNLMIYMGAELQARLIPMFRYALNPGGRLFLGNSETIGNFDELFVTVDRASRLYQRRDEPQGAVPAAGSESEPPAPPAVPVAAPPPPAVGGGVGSAKPTLRALTEQVLLRHAALTGALVNARGDLLYLHGRGGLYLEPAVGETAVANVLKMARKGLGHGLRSALQAAARSMDTVHVAGLKVRGNGHDTCAELTVCPLALGPGGAGEAPLFVVILHETPAGPAEAPAAPDAGLAALRQELLAKEDFLQAGNQDLEAANGALKAANEALQSLNEELQSSNEELETSKEELQSVNEELATVNAELQSRLGELSRANNDMNNLLAGTGIATVFVDSQLNLLRFTPSAAGLINLILSDVGRPISHIVTRLVGYDRLITDTQAVLDTLVPCEVAVQTVAGAWFTLRIQPYRTLANVIEGAVLTFVDISEIVRTREALHKANELLRLAVVVRDAHDAITVQDLNGRILAWNPGAVRLYGWSEAEALALNVRERIPRALQSRALERVHQLSQAEVLEPYLTQRIGKDGRLHQVSMISTALVNETGEMYAIATTERALPARGAAASAHAHATAP